MDITGLVDASVDVVNFQEDQIRDQAQLLQSDLKIIELFSTLKTELMNNPATGDKVALTPRAKELLLLLKEKNIEVLDLSSINDERINELAFQIAQNDLALAALDPQDAELSDEIEKLKAEGLALNAERRDLIMNAELTLTKDQVSEFKIRLGDLISDKKNQVQTAVTTTIQPMQTNKQTIIDLIRKIISQWHEHNSHVIRKTAQG